MTTIKSLINQLFDPFGPTEPRVHFHSGPEGQPAVCHDERCSSPRLDVR